MTDGHSSDMANADDVYAVLFDTINIPILACDSKWEIVASNPAALNFLGWKNGTLAGRQLSALFSASNVLEELQHHGSSSGEPESFTIETSSLFSDQRKIRARALSTNAYRSDWHFLLLSSLEDSILSPDDERRIRAETLHRIRNTVLTIRYLATYSAENASSIEEFLGVFRDRVDTTCRAVSLSGAAGSANVDLIGVITEQLATYGLKEGDNLSISGPAAVIGVSPAIACALTLNELAAFSSKRGALARDAAVEVHWRIEEGEPDNERQGSRKAILHIAWNEPAPDNGPSELGTHVEELANGLPSKLGAVVAFRNGGPQEALEVRLPLDVVSLPSRAGGGTIGSGSRA